MTVIDSDIMLFQCTNNPADDISTLGGAISATAITGGSLGEVFNKKSANSSGGADKITYGKAFFKNTNGSDTLYNPKIYIKNGLLSPSADGVLSFQSTSPLDTWATYKRYIKASYKNAFGNDVFEYIRLGGLSLVSGTGSVKAGELVNIELKTASGTSEAETDAQATAEGDITVSRGIYLGIIPQEFKSASGCYEIGLSDSLNDNDTTTNRLTEPANVSFSLANTESGAIDCVDDLGAGDAQGVWVKQTLTNGMLSVSDMQTVLTCFGDDS